MEKITLPNFFIVGAAKSGTTSLSKYLSQHPDVFMPLLKEPRFFCHEEFFPLNYYKQRTINNWNDYVGLFKDVKGEKAIGEASVHYLYFPSTPHLIKNKIPESKIIIILRDPVSRAISHYLMDLTVGFVKMDFDSILFGCMNGEKIRKHHIQYIELGFYFEQVKRYLDVFSKDNVLIFLFDDLLSDALQVVKKILQFLEVDPSINIDVSKNTNPFKTPVGIFRYLYYSIYAEYIRNWYLRNLMRKLLPARLKDIFVRNLYTRQKPEIAESTRIYLHNLYHSDILRLQELIGRNLDHWL